MGDKPQKKEVKPFAKQAAQASLFAPIITVVFLNLMRDSHSDPKSAAFIKIGIAGVILISGIVLGVFALTKMKRLGSKGIFVPSVIGIFLSVLFIVITVAQARTVIQEKRGKQAKEVFKHKIEPSLKEQKNILEKGQSKILTDEEVKEYNDLNFEMGKIFDKYFTEEEILRFQLLTEKIKDAEFTSAEYNEFLLFYRKLKKKVNEKEKQVMQKLAEYNSRLIRGE